MNVIAKPATEKPMNRKERRAAEHAARKAEYKKAKADARSAAERQPEKPWTEESRQALLDSCHETIRKGIENGNLPANYYSIQNEDEMEQAMEKLFAAQREAFGKPSEPLALPSVESYKGGPRTESGKLISSQNALKHGSCSTSILINPNESLDDFLALEQRWFQSYGNPQNVGESDLIKAAARAEWFYLRAERNYADYDNHLNIAHVSAANWTDSDHKTYARFLRYRTANLNILNKSRKAIEDFRKNRQQETAKIQVMEHAKEKLEIAKTKLAIYQEKYGPEPEFDDLLEDMRKKAERLAFRKPDTE